MKELLGIDSLHYLSKDRGFPLLGIWTSIMKMSRLSLSPKLAE
jgi:hypothetical protein